jgi:hypothetical protein
MKLPFNLQDTISLAAHSKYPPQDLGEGVQFLRAERLNAWQDGAEYMAGYLVISPIHIEDLAIGLYSVMYDPEEWDEEHPEMKDAFRDMAKVQLRRIGFYDAD